jgi:HEAT repeat protein
LRGTVAGVLLLSLAGTAAALDPALRKKAKDADSFERSDAARELAADGSREAVKLLVELIADRSPYVRDTAVESCSKLRAAEAVAILAKRANVRDELERRNVADALGRTRAQQALPALRRMALDDRSGVVRVQALDALWGFRENADALSIAAAAVGHADVAVRAAAVEAVGRIRGERARELVLKALEDPDEGVRCVARMELRHVDRDEASKRLLESLAAKGWPTRAQIVEDALHLRGAASMDALVRLVGDEHPRVAAGAHRALRRLTGKELGRDADLWSAWWKQNREGWRAPEGRLRDPAGWR